MAVRHYHEQRQFADSYLSGYFKRHIPGFTSMRVLEVGCAEAGVLSRLAELGLQVEGLELEAHRVELARQLNPDLKIWLGDIMNPALSEQINSVFDLIIMREVIEHVPARKPAFDNLNRLLKPGGYLYITFPPRFSPFGGHQQLGRSLLRFVPWLQLWPSFVIRWLGRVLNEDAQLIEFVLQNYGDGLTIGHFNRLIRPYFQPVVRELFLIRPVYRLRFGKKTLRFPDLPLLREFLATGCECLLQKRTNRKSG